MWNSISALPPPTAEQDAAEGEAKHADQHTEPQEDPPAPGQSETESMHTSQPHSASYRPCDPKSPPPEYPLLAYYQGRFPFRPGPYVRDNSEFDFYPRKKDPRASMALNSIAVKKAPLVAYRREDCTWVAQFSSSSAPLLRVGAARRRGRQGSKYFLASKLGFFRSYIFALAHKYMTEVAPRISDPKVNMLNPEGLELLRSTYPKVINVFFRLSDVSWVGVTTNDGANQFRSFPCNETTGYANQFWEAVAYVHSQAAVHPRKVPKPQQNERRNPEYWFSLDVPQHHYCTSNDDYMSCVEDYLWDNIRLGEVMATEKDIVRAAEAGDSDVVGLPLDLQGCVDAGKGQGLPRERLRRIFERVYATRDNKCFGTEYAQKVPLFPKVDGLSFCPSREGWVDRSEVRGRTHFWEVSRWGFLGSFRAALVARHFGALFQKHAIGGAPPLSMAPRRKRGRPRKTAVVETPPASNDQKTLEALLRAEGEFPADDEEPAQALFRVKGEEQAQALAADESENFRPAKLAKT